MTVAEMETMDAKLNDDAILDVIVDRVIADTNPKLKRADRVCLWMNDGRVIIKEVEQVDIIMGEVLYTFKDVGIYRSEKITLTEQEVKSMAETAHLSLRMSARGLEKLFGKAV